MCHATEQIELSADVRIEDHKGGAVVQILIVGCEGGALSVTFHMPLDLHILG